MEIPATGILSPAELEKSTKRLVTDVAGETPSEWALTAALGPIGRAATRAGLLSLSGATYSPESEAVLTRLGIKEIPKRLEKMYEMARQLRAQGRGGEAWQKSEGKLTIGPAGDIEAIHTPKAVDISRIKEGRPLKYSEVIDAPEMLAENPSLKNMVIQATDLPRNVRGNLRIPRAPGEVPKIGVSAGGKLTPEELSGVIGHESTHGFDFLHNLPYGANQRFTQQQIDNLIRDLGTLPRGASQLPELRAGLLRARLGDPGFSRELYLRNLGETRARAGQAGWQHGNLMDPYGTSIVGESMKLKPGVRPRLSSGTAYERVMDPSSPVYTRDIERIISELRQER